MSQGAMDLRKGQTGNPHSYRREGGLRKAKILLQGHMFKEGLTLRQVAVKILEKERIVAGTLFCDCYGFEVERSIGFLGCC